jgi:phage-related protein
VKLIVNLKKMKDKVRNVITYKNYFEDFFVKQKRKVKEKIIWTLDLIEELPRIPDSYFKHIENSEGLYEIRVKNGSDIFRIMCFFDHGNIIVLENGFQKKSQKTPKQEIEKAQRIKREYEFEKSLLKLEGNEKYKK